MYSIAESEWGEYVIISEIKGIYIGFACFQTAIQIFTLVNAMVFIKQHQLAEVSNSIPGGPQLCRV